MRRSAFTLIEIMIVVGIIGILAAIALPRFWDASAQAKDSAVLSTLHTVRGQIQMHDFNHRDELFNPIVPGGAAAWDQLIDNGYLQAAPKNPFQLDSTKVSPFPGSGTGWVWMDYGSGATIYAVNELGAVYDGNGDGTPD